jgi:hypothetical protein
VLSIASLDILDVHGDHLIQLKTWTDESLSALDQASTLNEKWQIIAELPDQLNRKTKASIRKCLNRVDDLKQARERNEDPEAAKEIARILGSSEVDSDLSRLCPAATDAQNPSFDPCLASIDLLADDGEIGQIQRSFKETACLARDIRDGLPETTMCIGQGDESSLCLKGLKQKKELLDAKKTLVLEPLIEGLTSFLKAEIARTIDQSESLTQDLSDLLNRIHKGDR